MLKTFRLRRFFGVIAAILGVAALAIAADPTLPPGACAYEDEAAGWVTADGGCKDLNPGGVVWSANVTDLEGRTLPWSMANAYCNNLTEGGFSDWRLPTPAEIQTAFLHDVMVSDPTVPGGIDHHISTHYIFTWTSQTKGNKATMGNLLTGVLGARTKTSGYYNECVRP